MNSPVETDPGYAPYWPVPLDSFSVWGFSTLLASEEFWLKYVMKINANQDRWIMIVHKFADCGLRKETRCTALSLNSDCTFNFGMEKDQLKI